MNDIAQSQKTNYKIIRKMENKHNSMFFNLIQFNER